MAKYVDATHNVLFTLNPDKWRADLTKSAEGDITGYQEAQLGPIRETIKAFCAANGRGLWHPLKCGNPISWKTSVFSVVRVKGKQYKGTVEVHRSAINMGINVKYNPARDFTYVGLNHKATGKKILRINVHPTATATRPESSPANKDSDELSVWKDWSIGQYWLDVLSFVSGQMSVQDTGTKNTASFWDVVTIGGDYNGALSNKDRWYYPGAILPALFENDEQMKGVDHLQHAHGSDCRGGKRWAVDGNTDHRIHFVERTFMTVPDFQRQL